LSELCVAIEGDLNRERKLLGDAKMQEAEFRIDGIEQVEVQAHAIVPGTHKQVTPCGLNKLEATAVHITQLRKSVDPSKGNSAKGVSDKG
jgi:hypothetical protein